MTRLVHGAGVMALCAVAVARIGEGASIPQPLGVSAVVAGRVLQERQTGSTDHQLRIGQQLVIEEGRLSIVFDDVRSDSRCPEGARCIRAGEAEVVLRVRAGSGEAVPIVFRVPPGGGDARESNGYRIEVARLDPEAEAGVEIAPEDYRATVRVERR